MLHWGQTLALLKHDTRDAKLVRVAGYASLPLLRKQERAVVRIESFKAPSRKSPFDPLNWVNINSGTLADSLTYPLEGT